MFKRIDHIEIVTEQMERTVEFYVGILGFTMGSRERVPRSGMGVPMDIVYLELNGTMIELIRYDGATPAPAPKDEQLGYRMMALEVEDMTKATEYLKAKGVEVTWGPTTAQKFARAEIRDCNGFRIELRQWFR